VALSLQAEPAEYSPALHHLRSIQSTAESRSDVAVLVAASSLEAMVHLYNGTPESAEQAQRAIAVARARSTQADASQLIPLLDIVDLACSIQQSQVDQAVAKMQGLQTMMDKSPNETQKDDGTVRIVIDNGYGGHLTKSTGGVFRRNEHGKDMLVLSWLKRRDLYILGYYLSGVTAYLKNATDNKSEKYLKEALKLVGYNLNNHEPEPSSLSSASTRASRHTAFGWYMRLHLALSQSTRGDWQSAQSSLRALRNGIEYFPADKEEDLRRYTSYLQGVVHQGLGNFDAALTSYRSNLLALPTTSPRSTSNPELDLQLLAALNTMSIISSPSHPEHHLVSGLIGQLEPYCLSHPNKSLVSAFHFVRASSSSQQEGVIKLKENLTYALNGARSVFNTQLMCVAMSLMTASFFNNIAGDQAEKSGTTSKSLAHRWGNKMWISVADGLLANKLEMRGKLHEAQQVRAEAEACMKSLPEPLKRTCSQV
jgi:tetratricopeptide (TPR) repeat protein